MSLRVARRFALSAALLGPLEASCSGKTAQAGGLELIISTDMPTPSRFDVIHVNVQQEGPGGTWTQPPLLDAFYPLGTVSGETALPTTIALAAGSSPYQEALITVTGLKGGQGGTTVVERVVETQVPTDRIAELRILPASVCAGVICTNGDSCQPEATDDAGAGSCAANTVLPAGALGVYNPGDVGGAGVATTAADAGGGGSIDAPEDGDATAPEPVLDGGRTEAEGSPDATVPKDAAVFSDALDAGAAILDASTVDGATYECPAGQDSTGWLQQGFDPGRSGYTPNETVLDTSNVANLAALWHNSVPSTINTSPMVANGVVYYGDYTGDYYAVDAVTGVVNWKASLSYADDA